MRFVMRSLKDWFVRLALRKQTAIPFCGHESPRVNRHDVCGLPDCLKSCLLNPFGIFLIVVLIGRVAAVGINSTKIGFHLEIN